MDKYGSLSNLILEYNKLDNIDNKKNLLQDLKINKRKLGQKLSEKIFLFL